MNPQKELLLVAYAVLASSGLCFSQKSQARRDSLKTESAKTSLYKKEPLWITMHRDTSVSYHEAVRAFNEYWKERPKPDGEEGELERKKEKDSVLKRLFMPGEVQKEKESEEYAFEYKRFNNWKRENAPFVQPNGRLLTPNERMELWKQQRPQD